MRLLIADTRPQSSGEAPEDHHHVELLTALKETMSPWELLLVTPGSPSVQEFGKDERQIVAWQLDGRDTLAFVQRKVPRIAVGVEADAILSLFSGAPMLAPVPVFSYLSFKRRLMKGSWLGRLATATGRAGIGGAAFQVVFSDLPASVASSARLITLRPWVDRRFTPAPSAEDRTILEALELQTGYVLAIGFSQEELPMLIAAWSWVVGSIGDSIPLMFLGLEGEAAAYVTDRVRQMDLESVVLIRSTPSLTELPTLYRQADLFVHGRGGGTGQALRWGLASGIPIAAFESPHTASIVGDAGYLIPPGDARGFGAAMLSILVQEEFAEELRGRGRVRSAGYLRADPLKPLADALGALLE